MAGPYQRVSNGDDGNSGATAATTLVNAHSSGLEALEYRRFNVRDYGATGDGSTNDTSAINSAIAALNAAGSGVLYFPTGDYLITSSLTAITVRCTVRGDGGGHYQTRSGFSTNGVTRIKTSTNGVTVFTIQADGVTVENLYVHNTNAGTGTPPTSGAGIAVTAKGNHCVFRNVWATGFYVNVDVQYGAEWQMHGCYFHWPTLYNLKVRNIDSPDGGDQAISDCWFGGNSSYSPSIAAHIRYESGGGMKLTNCKFNGLAVPRCVDVEFGTGADSGVLVFGNNSFENYTTDGVRIATTGSGILWNVAVHGNEFAPYNSNTTAVRLSGVSTSNLMHILVAANQINGQSGTGTAIVASNVGGLVLGPNLYGSRSGYTYATNYSVTGCTNVRNFDALV